MEQVHSNQKDQMEITLAHPAPGSGSNALEYIARLMGEQAGHRLEGTVSSSKPSPTSRKSGLNSLIDKPSDASNSLSSGENWQRIALASGVELHLREPVDPDTANRVQAPVAVDQSNSPHLNLALVIDRSGSMGGETAASRCQAALPLFGQPPFLLRSQLPFLFCAVLSSLISPVCSLGDIFAEHLLDVKFAE
jgi:hypothetical protein